MTTKRTTRVERSRERHNASRRGAASPGVIGLISFAVVIVIFFVFRSSFVSFAKSAMAPPPRLPPSPVVLHVTPTTTGVAGGFLDLGSQQATAMDVEFVNHTYAVLAVQNAPWLASVKPGDRLLGYVNEWASGEIYTGFIAPTSTHPNAVSTH